MEITHDPAKLIALDRTAMNDYDFIDIPAEWEGKFLREFVHEGQRYERVGTYQGCVAYRVSLL